MIQFHVKCVGISIELYEHLQKCVNLHWYWDGCNQGVGQAMEELCRIKQHPELAALEVNENERRNKIAEG